MIKWFFYIAVFIAYTSCKKNTVKKEENENTNTRSSAYLYASLNYQSNGAINYFYYATFCNPEKQLRGSLNQLLNITSGFFAAGNLHYKYVLFSNNIPLTATTLSSQVYYSASKTLQEAPEFFARWTLKESTESEAKELWVDRGFPKLVKEIKPDTIRLKSGLTISSDSTLTNYDTLYVEISDKVKSSGVVLKKFTGAENIWLSPADLLPLSANTGASIKIIAFNSSQMDINGKKVLYELSSRLVGSVVLRDE